MTLRTKTSILLILSILVAFSVAGILSLRFLEGTLRKSIFTGLESVSNASAESISKFLDDTLRDTQAIASSLPRKALEDKNVSTIEEHLKSVMNNYPKFENGMFLLDANGTLWADYPVCPGTRGKNFAFREYFKTTMQKQKGIIGIPYQSARTGEAVLTFTALLRGSKNQILGMIGCSVQLLHPNALGGIRKTKIGESGYLYVYDTSRLMILHPEDKRILQRDVPPGANRLFDAAIEGFEGVGETVNSRSVSMLVSLKQIPGTNWIIGAQQPQNEAFSPIREARLRIVLATLFAVLVAILAGNIAIRKLTHPLAKLRKVTAQLGQEPEGRGPPFLNEKEVLQKELETIQSSDEIGDLAEAFKEMHGRLGQTFLSLKQASREWERTFDSVHESIFLLDKDNRILRLNQSAAKLMRVDVEEAMGKDCFTLMHGTDRPHELCPHLQTLTKGEPRRIEIEEPFLKSFFEITTTPLVDETGQTIGSVHVTRDITEQKVAERALRQSEERYRILAEAAQEMIFIIDREGQVRYVNQFAANRFKSLPDKIIGRSINTLFPKETSDRQKNNLRKVFESGGSLYEENNTLFPDGERWLGTRLVPIRNESGEVEGVLGISRDITDQKRMEEALRESEEKYRSLVDHANDAIFIAQDGMVKFPNLSTVALTGYSEEDYLTRPFVNLIHPDDRETVIERHNRRLRGEEVQSPYSFRIMNKAGEEMWVHLNAVQTVWEKRPAILCFIRDITSQKRLEAQFQQAQKMEAVGTLAGGIAHDFNNLLQSILGYTEMLLMDGQIGDIASQELQEIKRATQRGAELTQQLLTFSRKVQSKLRPIDLNEEVVQVEKLLRRTIPKMVELELNLATDLTTISADPAQVEQVLMNLAVNSRDAMPEGGRLTIGTENVTLDETFCKKHLGAKPGNYVQLTVSDTGQGMNEGTLKRIFDPFYTTKGVGKGTGLGLAMVYGIVKSHEGYILCESEPGKGTTFKIYFSVTKEELVTEESKEEEEIKGGSETILLVEDEESIRNLGKQIFTKYGYTVLEAPDGESALRICEEKKEYIDLIILDLIMAGMGGKRCLDRILQIDPKAKVIIASGYSTDDPPDNVLKIGAKAFITKPFNIKQMLRVVREVLGN